MSIEHSKITPDQVNRILNMQEGHFSDLKSQDITPSKLTRTICAFANASGGELYIGIDENTISGKKFREWRGFLDEESANGHLQIFETLFPLSQEFSYSFLSAPDFPGLVLQVNIDKSRDLKKASDGKIYVRRGAQNLPVESREAINRLMYDKGIQSFETAPLDVEKEVISQSDVMLGFSKQIIPSTETKLWLKKQQLIRSEKPTVAGVLLFSDIPQAILPKRSGVKIYRYNTTALEGNREALAYDPITIEGCLYDEIRRTVDKTIEIVQSIMKITHLGNEIVRYPSETLHKIITNALLHRDYSIAMDVYVRIFDNRIEVESPGKLPGHVTANNILKEQFARNDAIVRLINKFPNPPNKDVGEGLRTAFAAMQKMKLQSPEIVEKENSVVVYIRHQPVPAVDNLIMDYLDDHEEISNQTARQISGIISEREIRQAFNRLRRLNLIQLIPGRSNNKQAWCKVMT
jgi:ATP-dependent DNA helicase RecG